MKTKEEVAKLMAAAYEYGSYLIQKSQNPNEKFLNHSVMCQLCLGTGIRIVYHYGKGSRKRCETATWDENKKRFICAGNSQWAELEKENKKDLSTEIWKVVSREKVKEAFMVFLKENYQKDKLADLLMQQLYTILCMLRSGKLVTSLTTLQYTINKAKAA